VPTISAVGHEVDITLCDLVADLRAPTPSAAAEAAVPVVEELRAKLSSVGASLQIAFARRTASARERVEHCTRALGLAAGRATRRKRTALTTVSARLHTLSPLATLARGYAIARAENGTTLASVAAFPAGLPFDLLLRDGTVKAVARDEIRSLESVALTPHPESRVL
jgi:exodeoxyribonuclease VII large subunit